MVIDEHIYFLVFIGRSVLRGSQVLFSFWLSTQSSEEGQAVDLPSSVNLEPYTTASLIRRGTFIQTFSQTRYLLWENILVHPFCRSAVFFHPANCALSARTPSLSGLGYFLFQILFMNILCVCLLQWMNADVQWIKVTTSSYLFKCSFSVEWLAKGKKNLYLIVLEKNMLIIVMKIKLWPNKSLQLCFCKPRAPCW